MPHKLENRTFSRLFVAGTVLALLGCADTALAQTTTLSVTPLTLSFSTAQGSPQPQNIQISSTTGASVGYTIAVSSQGNWLGTFPSSGTATTSPSQVSVFAVSGTYNNFTPGTYTGTVTITPSTGSPVTVTATLTVGAGGGSSGTYTATPNSLSFTTAFGAASTAQTFTLSTTAASTTVNLTPSANWISVTPTTAVVGSGTTATFTVIANALGTLPTGPANGTINISQSGSSGAALLQFPVSVSVGTGGTGTGNFNVTPSSLTFSVATPTSLVAPQSLSLTTTAFTNEIVTVTPTTNNGTGWLLANNSNLATSVTVTQSFPGTVSVTVNPSQLTSGTSYTGSITLQNSDLGTVTVPVTLNVGSVTSNSTITISPNPATINIASASVGFSTTTLQVSSTVNQNVTAQLSSGPSWVSISPAAPSFQTIAANSSQPFTVTVNPTGQANGIYSANILFTPTNGSTVSVPLSITIGSGGSGGVLTTTPSSLMFAYQTGTANPAPQAITLTSSNATTYSLN
ncbi:MAG: hypothetical protein JO022_02120, partial [Acidobacteriaceae bacterium]|nr:hypothetical protein [Acidobacteriaceae bacterium]